MTRIDAPGRHSLEPAAEPVLAPTFPRLVRVELRRLLARRFFLILVGVGVLAYVAGTLFAFTKYEAVTPEAMARATVVRDANMAQNQQFYQQCLADTTIPDNSTPEQFCGSDPATYPMEAEWFLDVTPFTGRDFENLAVGAGVGVAMLGLLLGATFIGAEWSSKNLVAWLFWEPRRLRLLGAKIIALLGVLLVLAVLAQVICFFTGKVLLATKGMPIAQMDPPRPEFWSDLFGLQLRAALFVIPAGLLGFGLANLMRNTAATLGVAVVYIIAEPILAWLNPSLIPYQLTSAALAWITPGGFEYPGKLVYSSQYGGMVRETLTFTNQQGGFVLLAYAVVVTAVSAILFRRRDIT
ncbi:hypothetical protein EH165_12525 [Nakamurella antarctica]|uniref:ABC-type transport system involved in multi-copper enzyme maturation, permease component n=1 Tax=Nakamurella antarctica TaxID=1902245 RepID=A0A3G8ZNK8_9ACTN|nr:ABC transporter permease subunit [Nakamurella antarctica]AZI58840.1 hypothetical protein EH165_12525 [Nakamurella antarctica]